MESFGLSLEDAQDKYQWRLRNKGESAKLGLPGERPLKWQVCDSVYVYSNLASFITYDKIQNTALPQQYLIPGAMILNCVACFSQSVTTAESISVVTISGAISSC